LRIEGTDVARARRGAAWRIANFAGLGLLLMTAACRSTLPVGEGAIASAAGSNHLAAIRASHGLSRLSADPRLERAALQQAGYMARAGRMAHDTGRGRDFASRMNGDGIAAPAAENLAHGRIDPDRLFAMWMASPGHRRNMLDERMNRFGLAYVDEGGNGGQRYWALVLAK
jgi:uncharacterized protein YkwD